MTSSGVHVQNAVVTAYEELKTSKKHRWMLMKFVEGFKEIKVERVFPKSSDQDADYEELLKEFKNAADAKECRYAVMDVEYSLGDAGLRNKLVFFVWAPDEAKVRERMVCSSSKDGLKKAIQEGLGIDIQANDESDLKLEDVIEKAKRNQAK